MASQYPYSQYVSNSYLGKSKTLKGMTQSEVISKANTQISKWNEEEKRAREREAKRIAVEKGKSRASKMNAELQEKIASINGLMLKSTKIDIWKLWDEEIYRHDEYGDFSFRNPPQIADAVNAIGGIPQKSFTEAIFRRKKERREAQEALAQRTYQEMLSQYESEESARYNRYQSDKAAFYEERQAYNNGSYKVACATPSNPTLFEKLATTNLDLISKQIFGNPKMTATLAPDGKMMVISVPALNVESMPAIREYRFVAARDSIDELPMKKSDVDGLYDSYVFSTTAFVINTISSMLFEKGIETVVVNIWVNGIDPKTGNDFTSCILSVQVSSDEVENIDFSRVNPKECIKGLKGLYAGNLTSLTPVRPIAVFNKVDARFVESRDILSEMDPTQNLAIMDWQDFEQLVRQIFGNIFEVASGGEVKITRASRDAGVDAIAFDPDPIRGGKIVIQAKRYNNVVGVSAVRDLYGTMISEGAGKGILVTTSHFGKDSRDFAKDKPIQLIDGSHLLSLLEENGYGNFNITLGQNRKNEAL